MLILAVAVAVLILRRPSPRPAPSAVAASASPIATVAPSPASNTIADEALRETSIAHAWPSPPSDTGLIAREDAILLQSLSLRLRFPSRITPQDIAAAEGLAARYPHLDGPRSLLHSLLLTASLHARRERRYDSARSLLKRAQTVSPGRIETERELLALHIETGDWISAEQVARSILARVAADPEASKSLAFVLMRLDRDREAFEVLKTLLDTHEDPDARVLLARIQKTMSDETGMREQRLSHFDVRYDGEAHESVGREILRVLERHYATLTLTFGFEPRSSVPVILFSRHAYHDASGAPVWSGGAFDSIDGRIRVPIGGLTESLTPELDCVLIHELTHAFVAEHSRGKAPRELHEGLAQYMEGKRIETLLSPEQIDALAQGRIDGVRGFYLNSLAFVEFLISLRGQSGINDLLTAMGESGRADAAFDRIYGKGFAALLRDSSQYHSLRSGQ